MTSQRRPSAEQLRAARWVKSSRSGQDNECVETADLDGWTGIRDSKVLGGRVLVVPRGAFDALLGHLSTGS